MKKHSNIIGVWFSDEHVIKLLDEVKEAKKSTSSFIKDKMKEAETLKSMLFELYEFMASDLFEINREYSPTEKRFLSKIEEVLDK